DLLLARDATRFGIAGDLARQRAAEAGEVRAAVALRDVVGEAQHGLVVAVVPPQRALDAGAFALGLHDDRLRHQRRLVAVEIFDECLDAALVAQLLALLDGVNVTSVPRLSYAAPTTASGAVASPSRNSM